MAIYQKVNYHEDTVKKHEITEEEISFLKNLQKEMNTQDHVCQAAPRFWVIRQPCKIYNIKDSNCDGYQLYINGLNMKASTLDEMFECVKKELSEITDITQVDHYGKELRKESCVFGCEIVNHILTVKKTNQNDESSEWGIKTIEELHDWIEYMNIHYNLFNNWAIYSYQNTKINCPDTFFITHKEAEKHLKNNYYNYDKDAHAYAMTAFRSPEVEKLWDILEKVDWNALLKE